MGCNPKKKKKIESNKKKNLTMKSWHVKVEPKIAQTKINQPKGPNKNNTHQPQK